MTPLRIFQYSHHSPNAEGTRWIAADTEEKADLYAARKGWRKAGGEVQHSCGTDRGALRRMGCDVVLS